MQIGIGDLQLVRSQPWPTDAGKLCAIQGEFSLVVRDELNAGGMQQAGAGRMCVIELACERFLERLNHAVVTADLSPHGESDAAQ